MNNMVKYSAVNTKIRVLEGKLLKEEEYIRLLSFSSVREVVHYLKHNTHYKGALMDVNEANIHRSEIELILKKTMIDALEKITYYYRGNNKKFIQTLFARYEIEDLKIIIRSIYTDRDYIKSRGSLVYIGRYGEVDYDKIVSAKSFNELIDALEDTPYYEYLFPLIGKVEKDDQFQIEMTLDLAFFRLLKKNIKLLTISEQKLVNEIQGIRADLFNIEWIYRGKKFYGLSPELLFNYTIDLGYALKYKDIKKLSYCKSINELEKEISKTPYRFLFGHGNEDDAFMERRMYRYHYHKLREIKKRGGMDIAQTIIYFRFLEFETRDIISIIENIRYGINDIEMTKKYLIREF